MFDQQLACTQKGARECIFEVFEVVMDELEVVMDGLDSRAAVSLWARHMERYTGIAT